MNFFKILSIFVIAFAISFTLASKYTTKSAYASCSTPSIVSFTSPDVWHGTPDSATVTGYFCYDNTKVTMQGSPAGSVYDPAYWSYVSQGPGYYYGNNQTVLTMWYNVKYNSFFGPLCLYPRAVAYASGATSGYDGDNYHTDCSF